jgi:hypothetical protein
LIADDPAFDLPIHVSLTRSSAGVAELPREAPTAGRFLDGYLVPLFVVAVLFTGSALLVGAATGHGGYAAGLGVVLAGGILAGVAIFLRARFRNRSEPSVEPWSLRVSTASAFVCANCAEYTPAPNWEALLRDSIPAEGVGRSGSVERALTTLAPATPAPWGAAVPLDIGSLPLATPVGVFETDFLPPSSSRAPADPGDLPDLMLFSGRLVPNPFGPAGFSISGAHRPVGSSARGTAPVKPGNRPRRETPTSPTPGGPSAGLPGTSGREVSVPTLESWILAEVEGLVRSSLSEELPAPSGTQASSDPPCAACKQEMSSYDRALVCPDCLRPICDPCRGRVVEHDGATWCGPCAVIRLSTEFLGAMEDPTGPSGVPETTIGLAN